VLNNLGYVVIDATLKVQDTENPLNTTIVMTDYLDFLGGVNAVGVDMEALSIITHQHDTTYSTYVAIPTLFQWLNDTFASNRIKFVSVVNCLGRNDAYKSINPLFVPTSAPPTDAPTYTPTNFSATDIPTNGANANILSISLFFSLLAFLL